MPVRPARRRGDDGQALPVYITVIGALLFLAFAYFAVGQAAATRSGAQTAADAAALAATQDRATQIRAELLRALRSGDLGEIGQLLGGRFGALVDSCGRAQQFAQDNRAHTTSCQPVPGGYAVRVETDYTVGRSVVPGTERRHAHASATAVMTALCRWQGDPDSPSSTPSPPGASAPPTPSPSASAASPGTLVCRAGTWSVDPGDLGDLPSLADLFSVHLTS